MNTCVSGSIIDNSTKIGSNCVLETGTVIGPRVIIQDNVTIHSHVNLWPELIIPEGRDVSETVFNPDYDMEIT